MPGFGFGMNRAARRRVSGGGGAPPGGFASLAGIGDSITAGVGASVQANRWLELYAVAKSAGAPLNQGISGTVLQNSNQSGGTPQTNNGRDRFVSALLGANKKDAVVVAYGYNDARYTGAPGTFDVTGYQNDLDEVVCGLINGGYSRDKIVMVAPYYITDVGLTTGTAGYTGQTRLGFEAFVTACATVAGEHGVLYADAYTYMRDNGGASLISGDNLHPNDSGHAAIATCVGAAAKVNTNALPSVTASAGAAGVLNFTLTAPASGTVTDYTVEYALEGTNDFGNATTTASLSGSFTGLPLGKYRLRARANFADASKSPWAFSATQLLTDTNVFLIDNFSGQTDDSIEAHTSDTGGTWSVQNGYAPTAPAQLDRAHRLYSRHGLDVYRASETPPSANYYVEAVFDYISTLSADAPGIAGRMDAAANTFYWAGFLRGTGWRLFKTVAGTSTQLGSTVADTFTAGSKVGRLVMNGNQISFVLDGSTIIGPVTDSAIAAAGVAGVRMAIVQSLTTGIHLNSIKAVGL